MDLGPFNIRIKEYRDIDIYGADTITLYDPDKKREEDELKAELGDDYIENIGLGGDSVVPPTEDRSFVGGDLMCTWDMSISTDKAGVWNMDVILLSVKGELKLEDLPIGADPKDMSIELVEYSVDFDSEKMGFKCLVDMDTWRGTMIGDGQIYPSSVELDMKLKTVTIRFNE